MSLATALVLLGIASCLAWLGITLHPARPWDLSPVGDDGPPPDLPAWPSVCVLVPARNEAPILPRTLPALLAQDYPGDWRVVVVDDRSEDGTAAVAEALDVGRLTVVRGASLPRGWVGKVWALEQGARAAGDPEYLLLTDADIRHEAGSLRRLVAESECRGLDLDSRMARLRADSAAERLLIPPFLFFFNLLYPMRWVNEGRTAAAAGGCILLRRAGLERAGGFEAIRGEVIDDVHLAKAVRRAGGRLRLAISRREVVSLREHESLASVWRMVRRSAFNELRYSWPLLAGTVIGLLLLFAVPPGLLAFSPFSGDARWPVLTLLGAGAWALMTALFLPTIRFFGLCPLWALTFPLGGLLYGAMTIDSALRHSFGHRVPW
ncbi:MAG TPA: glycosyltransferase [Candidatus Dormibacteraeota bacterium]|nr:glycosyltransferase [Candidatus Dormibacteraeota bacterium]